MPDEGPGPAGSSASGGGGCVSGASNGDLYSSSMGEPGSDAFIWSPDLGGEPDHDIGLSGDEAAGRSEEDAGTLLDLAAIEPGEGTFCWSPLLTVRGRLASSVCLGSSLPSLSSLSF